jgi:ketosteroid isomerase-like protein
MTENAMRGVVHAFCDALAARAPELFSTVLDNDVEWVVFGPIDLFPFFGQRRGKAAVMDAFGDLSANLSLIRCEKETVLVDGDRAAGLVRLNAVDTRTGRSLSLRLALFAEFRDGKLMSMKALFDSFDAVEQALGHHIDLSNVA